MVRLFRVLLYSLVISAIPKHLEHFRIEKIESEGWIEKLKIELVNRIRTIRTSQIYRARIDRGFGKTRRKPFQF